MGAWIETPTLAPTTAKPAAVAPFLGAWIETLSDVHIFFLLESHPSWVRGLKPPSKLMDDSNSKSHPSWVRGLKQAVKW